jgi:hypothetical protein
MNDLERQGGLAKSRGHAVTKAAQVFQRQTHLPAETGEDCARLAKDPERRFEPLRRNEASVHRTEW